jgi:GNAT superfamily N-acetyltransferase
MGDEPGMNDFVIEPAGASEMKDGARVFAGAMGRDETHIEEWLFEFSRRLAEAKVGHFVVARSGPKVVGYGSLVSYTRVGWIGFMGVAPGSQRMGIGTALMERLLQLAERRGLRTLKLDATNVGKVLYSKFGFEEEHPARRFEIPGLCTRGAHRDGAGVTVRIAERMPEWCLSMDRRAFGDDRSPLISAALRRGAKLLLIESRGFGLLDGKKLGPVVAVDVNAAVEIVRGGSGLGANLIYVARHPELPTSFLTTLRLPEEHGPITCCTRMGRGEPVEQDLHLVYADYSAATG